MPRVHITVQGNDGDMYEVELDSYVADAKDLSVLLDLAVTKIKRAYE